MTDPLRAETERLLALADAATPGLDSCGCYDCADTAFRAASYDMAAHIRALQAENDRLKAENDALKVDAERLDLLDRNLARNMGWEVGQAPSGNYSVTSVIFAGSKPASLRDAIDAAINRERGG